jgi:hypothetical protein
MTTSEMTFERHFSVDELAALWGMSDDFVRRLFLHESGVVVFFHYRPGRRVYRNAADSGIGRPAGAPADAENVTLSGDATLPRRLREGGRQLFPHSELSVLAGSMRRAFCAGR